MNSPSTYPSSCNQNYTGKTSSCEYLSHKLSSHLKDVQYPCSHCAKEGLKRLGLYTNSKGEKVCDFHQYNPSPLMEYSS